MMNRLTCREATRLLIEGEDRELSAADRLALEAHVKICSACERFIANLGFMRRAMGAWRKHSEEDGEDPPPG